MEFVSDVLNLRSIVNIEDEGLEFSNRYCETEGVLPLTF